MFLKSRTGHICTPDDGARDREGAEERQRSWKQLRKEANYKLPIIVKVL